MKISGQTLSAIRNFPENIKFVPDLNLIAALNK